MSKSSFKIIILFFFLLISFSTLLKAEIVSKITIEGNNRISPETIKMFSGVSEKDDLSSKESVCNEKITQIQSKIDRLKKQISNLEKTNNFVVIYDKDDNGLLDIAETTNIDKLLSKHQKNIREIEKAENTSFIPDLVKVNTYLNDYQNNLVEEFKSVNNSYSEDTDVDSKTKKFTEDFEMYKVLISTLVLMIDSIVKDNHILYFKLIVYTIFLTS